MRVNQAQPVWVPRLAVGVAMVVLLATVLVLVIPALTAGLLVMALGSLVTSARRGLARLVGGRHRDGRRNVRVIVRHDQY